jgi:RNA polymerase sigma-70 factor (ECF subfamily)
MPGTKARRNVSPQTASQVAKPGATATVPVEAVTRGATVLTPRGVLVERARAGDRSAFEALLDRWLDQAFRIALAILGREADARDATQDAFLQAWRELPRLRDPERFDAWLSRIVVNSCRGVLRGRRRVTIREISLDDVPGHAEPATEFEAAWGEQPASLDALEHAFDRLSVPDRAILVLHHLEHRPLVEIAEVLGIPVGTAKSRLFAARHALERALEDELR